MLLQGKTEQINALSIHVDFLPSLEVLKAKSDEAALEHAFFLVPKRCSVCEDYKHNKHWRRSNCMAEISFIINEMSEKHRNCYKIIKFILSRFENDYEIHWYHVKTVALNHSRECSDSSEGCAECVLKMLTELTHAYETKTLNSFYDSDIPVLNENRTYSTLIFERVIERLFSVTNTDTCNTLLEPL